MPPRTEQSLPWGTAPGTATPPPSRKVRRSRRRPPAPPSRGARAGLRSRSGENHRYRIANRGPADVPKWVPLRPGRTELTSARPPKPGPVREPPCPGIPRQGWFRPPFQPHPPSGSPVLPDLGRVPVRPFRPFRPAFAQAGSREWGRRGRSRPAPMPRPRSKHGTTRRLPRRRDGAVSRSGHRRNQGTSDGAKRPALHRPERERLWIPTDAPPRTGATPDRFPAFHSRGGRIPPASPDPTPSPRKRTRPDSGPARKAPSRIRDGPARRKGPLLRPRPPRGVRGPIRLQNRPPRIPMIRENDSCRHPGVLRRQRSE